MDGKGDGEEITYPHICFSVDNFEDGFEDVIVRDGESVGIELTASAPRHSIYIRTVSSYTRGPPLTQKLLTRFPLPRFLAYVPARGGFSR